MNQRLQTLAAMTKPARYIDDVVRFDPWTSMWRDPTLDLTRIPDVSPLPPLVLKTGAAPREALIHAIVDADLDALRAELAQDTTSINDAMPAAKGRTLLHLAASLHGFAAKGNSAADKMRRLALEHITSALLDAGADPLAEDELKLYPATLSHGYTPACLRDRMTRAAREGRFNTSYFAQLNKEKPKKKA